MSYLRRVERLGLRLHPSARSFTTSLHQKQKDGWNDKLRILFCGSGRFSSECLKAVHEASKKFDHISSIEVVARTDKKGKVGRKKVPPPLIKEVAHDLNLPLHQLDTFTGWTPPDINLIIAVSFGLLIPSRIIDGSKHGGLNVHPSLLPDLRGAAPIQWAIMHGKKETGVSVQTLHPTKFDHGVVLAQSQPQPIASSATKGTIFEQLAPLGAEMLVSTINDRLYIPPYNSVAATQPKVELAPNITTEHATLDCEKYDAHELVNRRRALGHLHAWVEDSEGKKLRVRLNVVIPEQDRLLIATEENTNGAAVCKAVPVGVPYALIPKNHSFMHESNRLMINTKDGRSVSINQLGVEAKGYGPPIRKAVESRFFGEPETMPDGSKLHKFLKPLAIE